MTTQRDQRESAAGQALVIMVGGILAVIVMVGLIIDGGNAWAQQRVVQNGSDAAAEAGAVIMGARLAGATAPVGGWDLAVATAVSASAAANGIMETAYYTDICGIPLKADGSAALTAGKAYDLAHAQQVGLGLPTITSSTPNCPSAQVGPPAGVIVLGHKAVSTYLVNVVGISTWSVNTQATAAAGYLQESCDASQGAACALLPVAIPVDIVTCDGSNNPLDTGFPWSLNVVYKVPLCKNGPGNVGWLDWTPPGGGTSELIQSIKTPNNPAIPLPSWQYVTSTGNINDKGVEDAIRAYDGQIVLIPQFDATCNPGNGVTPDSSEPAIDDPNAPVYYGCGVPLGGNGQNQWYRMPSFAHFQLCISTDPDCMAAGVNAPYGAYTNGNNSSVCDTGNGATACLVGKIVSTEESGTIAAGLGGGTGSSKAIGIQLIK